jgi:hypothetical protein
MNRIIFIERLHRYVFDNIFIQSHKTTFIDRIILFVYKRLTIENHNWRFEIHKYAKSIVRYSDFDREDFNPFNSIRDDTENNILLH